MKKIFNVLVLAILILGGVVLNVANVSAQLPDITVTDTTDYKNGVEKFIGAVVPGSDDRAGLYIIFVAPDDVVFTSDSYTLTGASWFSLSDIKINASNDTLQLAVHFRPDLGVEFGDYLDTLTVSAKGANDFVLPLKGSVAPFTVKPSIVLFHKYVAAHDTSDVAEQVTITAVELHLEEFTFTLKDGSAFYVEETGETPGDISTVSLALWFAPPEADSGPTLFLDTLVVSHIAFPNVVYQIPVSGHSLPVKIDPDQLHFYNVTVDSTYTLSLNVEINVPGVTIDAITLTDSTHFSYKKGSNWDPAVGGELLVSFRTDTILWFYLEKLILSGTELDSIGVPLIAAGVAKPVITSDTKEVDFGEVPVGKRRISNTITVVLTDRVEHLDKSSFSIENPDEIFRVETLQLIITVHTDTAYLTLSFNPDADISYRNTLIVHSRFADDFRILLTGEGIEPLIPALSPQQATAISGQAAAAAPVLSVRDGEIVVSGAPAGSSVQVYNLQGETLKTQAVASDAEALKTADFPQSVYIVLVNDRNQVILKQKVLLP